MRTKSSLSIYCRSLEPTSLGKFSTDYKFAVSFTILVIVLLIRPSGIFKGRYCMKFDRYEWTAISIMVSLFILVGFIQGWSVSLVILNMCIISAIMTMGVNISWGYAGVINFGVMGFLAMGGLAAVLVSYPPIKEAWQVGGSGLGISFILLVLLITVVYFINKLVQKKLLKYWLNGLIIFFGILIIRYFFLNATSKIEEVDPALAGFLGGANLPIIFSWAVGGFFAAGVAFIGK